MAKNKWPQLIAAYGDNVKVEQGALKTYSVMTRYYNTYHKRYDWQPYVCGLADLQEAQELAWELSAKNQLAGGRPEDGYAI